MISKAFCTKLATPESETYCFIMYFIINSKKFDILNNLTKGINKLHLIKLKYIFLFFYI